MKRRVRTRSRLAIGGYVTYPGPAGPQVGANGPTEFQYQSMEDYIGKTRRTYDPSGYGLPPSYCLSTKIEKRFTPLNGGSSPTSYTYKGWVPSVYASESSAPISTISSKDKGDTFYVTRLLARSNPYRPYFSVPVAWKELVEVTALFGFAARSLGTAVGGTYLNYRFGWLSFLNDILALDGVVKQIERRVKELNSITESGGLRRSHVALDSFGAMETSIGPSGGAINSTWGHTVYATWMKSTKREVWGSVRWYPRYNGGKITIPTEPLEVWRAAVKQVFDLEEVDALTAYQMIPWSWLLDYFTNIGDILGSIEGNAYVQPKDVCIMRSTKTKTQYKRAWRGTATDKISGGDGVVERTVYERKVISSLPSNPVVFTPLLSMSEYKVVLALTAKFFL